MKQNIAMLLVLALLVSGCGQSGPEMYPVTGTVTYQGKPLPLGMVMFVSKDGPSSQPAPISENGRYRLEAVSGEHLVQVVAMPPSQGGRPDPNVEGGVDYTGAPEVESLIPRKYSRYDTSTVTVVVRPTQRNEIDIRLE